MRLRWTGVGVSREVDTRTHQSALAIAAPPSSASAMGARRRSEDARGRDAWPSASAAASLTSMRTSAASCTRCRGSFRRQRPSSKRIRGGVSPGRACQSGSPRRTAATVSERLALANAGSARQHLVDHTSQSPDVGAPVHGCSTSLLGAHVGGCAEDHPLHGQPDRAQDGRRIGEGDRRRGVGIERLGEPEVQNLDGTIPAGS